jgi:hypothetical protein
MATKRRKRRTPSRTLGEVTKKDFVSIAEILCSHGASVSLTTGLAHYFKSQNPRFNSGRFLRATKSCKV